MIKVAIDDHHRTAAPTDGRCNDCNIACALLNTTSVAGLIPKQTEQQGVDITVATFRDHYQTLKSTILSLSLDMDVKHIMKNTMLPGILHIIEHEDDIVEHVTTRYGVLYYLTKKLPLHTDHSMVQDPEEYRATLRRLLENIIGSFYLAERAGQLTEWCNRLSDGYCFEGKVRNTFTWIANYTDIKSFNDLMANSHKEYQVYEKIIGGRAISEIGNLNTALQFIMQRYQDEPCMQDKTYAPRHRITRKGVKKYLKNVLEYDDHSPEATGKHAPFLARLDHLIAHSKNQQQREAIYALRFAMVHAPAEQPVDEIILRWKETESSATGQSYASVIAQRNSRNPLFSFFKHAEKTKAEKLIDEMAQIRKFNHA